MANYVNNKPRFKIGDKVIYSRQHTDPWEWEKQSIKAGPMVIKMVQARYENDKLVKADYYTEETPYAYEENWLSYAPGAGPKFKIGDKVKVKTFVKPIREITDIVTLTFTSDNHTEYVYILKGEPFKFEENDLEAISNDELLIHDLEICGGANGCTGCSREGPDSSGIRCDKLELDAAELIKKLQKRVKELEEKK